MAGLSTLRVISNTELIRREEEQTRRELDERQNQPLMLGMSG